MAYENVRAPAASYVRALESRLQELETFLSKLGQAGTDRDRLDLIATSLPHSIPSAVKSESGSGTSPGSLETSKERSSSEPPSELTDHFKGLRMEADGRISFHGSTSFFQFPSSSQDESAIPTELPPTGPEGEARRNRLTRNAWQQRVFEQYANVPVFLIRSTSNSTPYLGGNMLMTFCGCLGTISVPS
jgi:hypothetical protein